MRQTSSFSLHRIAAAIVDAPPAFTTAAAAMSSTSRPPFRGGRGRGRRPYSDRPQAESQFQPVLDSNSGFRNNTDYRAVNYTYNSYTNNYSQNSNVNQFNNGGNRGNNYRGRSPQFNRRINQPPVGRVQRPKPVDYRTWEVATHPPPPKCERFVVLSYNILADYLANSHRRLYFHIPRRFMSWEWRKGNILFELRLWSPDIMCFQEVDKFPDFEEDLRIRGYSGIWKMRTGEPIDGCAIFWRTTRFKLMHEESVEFNKHGMRDNVAQICVLESLIPNKNGDQLASLTSPEGPKRVVICNIHVLYNPRRGEIKLGQVRILLEKAQAVSKMWDDAPMVLCGDFNCTPKSPLYNFISEQKLDISEFERDKISGQASAEVRPPRRPSGFQPREQSTSNVASPTTVQNTSTDSKQNDSLENNNHQIPVSLQQPPVDSTLNVPGNPFEKNTGKMQATDNLSDIQDGNTCMSEVDITSANLTDPPINETLKDSESSDSTSMLFSENVISSALPLKEQEIVEASISVDSSCNRLSSVSDHSDKNKMDNAIICEASDPNRISSLKHDISEKFIGLSLNENDESVKVDVEIVDSVEDVEEALSDLNSEGDAFPPNFGDLVPVEETVDVDKPLYDPSLWTPMEIATATGDPNSTILEHPLKLSSTYSEVVGSSGTRDSNGEPLVTSYHTCFMGTVDYIWRSEGLCTNKVLAPISTDAMQASGGFPTKKWGSDHIALASELAFSEK